MKYFLNYQHNFDLKFGIFKSKAGNENEFNIKCFEWQIIQF